MSTIKRRAIYTVGTDHTDTVKARKPSDIGPGWWHVESTEDGSRYVTHAAHMTAVA